MTEFVKVAGLQDLTRDLRATGIKLSDLDFVGIAREGARLAAQFAPRRSGKLAATIKGSRSKSKATIRAGSARVPYAGAINYGWRRRRIAPANFMQRTDDVLRRTVPVELRRQVERAISAQGLS